jgi:predicted RecB family nuclease
MEYRPQWRTGGSAPGGGVARLVGQTTGACLMAILDSDFTFSQSSLQDYVDCARRFELKYLLRQRYPAPEVDNMLEFEKHMEQGERFHRLVHQHIIGLPPDVLRQHINDEDVRRWFEAYLASGLTDVPEKRFPEQALAVPLGDYLLMAKFDLVALGERVLITDWKTSHRLPRREWMAQKLQTVVYRYVLAKGGAPLNGGQPIAPEQIDMRYWFADHDGETIAFSYDAAQYEADEAYLLGLIREIEARETFPLTTETQRCAFCTYRSLCDRGSEAGSLADWEALDYNDNGLDSFDINIDQIAEIEF